MHLDVRPSPISSHRLQRLMRWAMLWLLRLAAMLNAGAAVRPRVAYMARLVGAFLMIAAAQRVLRFGDPPEAPLPITHPSGGVWRLAPRGSRLRAVLGGRIRRMLRGRDLDDQIARLLSVLHAPERALARLIARLKAGMTRWRRLCPRGRAMLGAVCDGPIVAVSDADTS